MAETAALMVGLGETAAAKGRAAMEERAAVAWAEAELAAVEMWRLVGWPAWRFHEATKAHRKFVMQSRIYLTRTKNPANTAVMKLEKQTWTVSPHRGASLA